MLRVFNCLINQPHFIAPHVPMNGKTVVLTGPTIGSIGYETARYLAKFGASTILGGRNLETVNLAAHTISQKEQIPSSAVTAASLDLSELDSVSKFSRSVHQMAPAGIDVLICNAGMQTASLTHTKEKVEMTFAVCALGHHLLIHQLKPRRVVWVTGDIYALSRGIPDPFANHAGHTAYVQACLARMLLAKELKTRNARAAVEMEVVCVHPGVVNSDFAKLSGVSKKIAAALLIGPELGAQASVMAASTPSEQLHQDCMVPYYHNKNGWMELDRSDLAMNGDAAQQLFDRCDIICDISRS